MGEIEVEEGDAEVNNTQALLLLCQLSIFA